MSEVNGNIKIWLEDPVSKSAVYIGWLTELKTAEVSPHTEMIDHFLCTWLTLNEIADIIGYSSPPQVVRFFKRRTNMTPYEYRKMALKERARLQE